MNILVKSTINFNVRYAIELVKYILNKDIVAFLIKDGRHINLNSVLGVLSAGIKKDEILHIKVVNYTANENLQQIKTDLEDFFNNNK